ncbi:MAG: 6-carboxytetrahydropterin synthase [Opitutaceae bacterium]|jgi:6-pyruvoyltetrahydropterin/6-carboxytetrahydropterin synthase
MPYRICKTFVIESGHILSKHPGKCRFPHGHSRTVEIVLAADRLDASDMVCDFKVIKNALHEFLDSWDHALCLNTDDPNFTFYQKTYQAQIVPFAHADPTSEVMAKAVFDELKRKLAEASARSDPGLPAAGVRIERVRITETSSSWAEYFE